MADTERDALDLVSKQAEDTRITFIRNQREKAIPQPSHHGAAPPPTWDQVGILLAALDAANRVCAHGVSLDEPCVGCDEGDRPHGCHSQGILSDDDIRFKWLAENYAYVMVNSPQGMTQMADPTGKGDLRAAVDAWTEKLAGTNRRHAQSVPQPEHEKWAKEPKP